MRDKTKNLFKAADYYNSAIVPDDREYEEENEQVSRLFKEALSDYKRLIKKCSKEGSDVSLEMTESENINNEFREESTIQSRAALIEQLSEKIMDVLDICDDPPKDIAEKYASQDLVNIIEDGCIIEDDPSD